VVRDFFGRLARLYDHPQHCRACLAEFRARYNEQRPHWGLVPAESGDVLTPADVYVLGRTTEIPRYQAWARAAQAKLEKMMEDAARGGHPVGISRASCPRPGRSLPPLEERPASSRVGKTET